MRNNSRRTTTILRSCCIFILSVYEFFCLSFHSFISKNANKRVMNIIIITIIFVSINSLLQIFTREQQTMKGSLEFYHVITVLGSGKSNFIDDDKEPIDFNFLHHVFRKKEAVFGEFMYDIKVKCEFRPEKRNIFHVI